MREIIDDARVEAKIIVFDDMHGAKVEAGEFIHTASQGNFKFDAENVYTLDCITTTHSCDGSLSSNQLGRHIMTRQWWWGHLKKIE